MTAQSTGPGRPTPERDASARTAFRAGARAVSPLLAPAAAVGLVTGVGATTAGLSPAEAVAMSVLVYSPTVMLTAFQLLAAGAPTVVLVATSLVVGVRFAMLSLSIAGHFARLARRWKWLLAYFLWTPSYALSVERFAADPATDRRGYYLGTAVPLWVVFQAAVVAGVALGARVPAGWHLEFVVPLAFLALLARMVRDRSTGGAAAVAGAAATLGVLLPLNLGVVVAAVCGVLAGVLLTGGGRR